MKTSTRARVVAIIGAKHREGRISSVYDYDQRKYRNDTVTIHGGQIQGFDYDTSSHFTGDERAEDLSFYDYETNNHVQLRFTGQQFSGYDYHTEQHFSGMVSGSSIALYDHEDGQYHSYSV